MNFSLSCELSSQRDTYIDRMFANYNYFQVPFWFIYQLFSECC